MQSGEGSSCKHVWNFRHRWDSGGPTFLIVVLCMSRKASEQRRWFVGDIWLFQANTEEDGLAPTSLRSSLEFTAFSPGVVLAKADGQMFHLVSAGWLITVMNKAMWTVEQLCCQQIFGASRWRLQRCSQWCRTGINQHSWERACPTFAFQALWGLEGWRSTARWDQARLVGRTLERKY